MANILIIDDDQLLAEMLEDQLSGDGHQTRSAYSLAEGRVLLNQWAADVVLLDVQLPDGNGLEFISVVAASESHPEVIIITGQGDADGAEKAVIGGAWSYIEKPYVIRELPLQLTRTLQYRKEKLKVATIPVALKRDAIIGSSPAIRRSLDKVARASSSDASVLVTGATGCGKELFARAIHDNSNRAGMSFVVVDCAALPETLIESTLFGHVKGAFTNADSAQDGLVKHADGGTLFLDEVGELPFSIQKTFLRLLQEHEYRPVGSTRQVYSDFRVVAATNRDLEQFVREGRFREDLLFRLKAFTVELPELKERLEDIRDLTLYFISRLCRRYRMEIKGVADDFIDALENYDWPGNVRELYQTIEQVFANPNLGPTLFAVHLPAKFRVLQARAGVKSQKEPGNYRQQVSAGSLLSWANFKQKCELDYLMQMKEVSVGNVAEASRISGLSRTRLYQLIEKYGIDFSG